MTRKIKELASTRFCDKNLQVTSVGVLVIVVCVCKFSLLSFKFSLRSITQMCVAIAPGRRQHHTHPMLLSFVQPRYWASSKEQFPSKMYGMTKTETNTC